MTDGIIQHTGVFRRRRFFNWFPMGLAYAFLYMGRYNLTVSKIAFGNVMSKADFGIVFGVGTVIYALSFLINGPLTDRIGGKRGILISLFGAGIMNMLMGIYTGTLGADGENAANLRIVFTILYAGNMYFQSYGALSIVKVNSHWFHVRERGGFSGIFGAMISSGIFFAFTVNAWLLAMLSDGGSANLTATKFVFFIPAGILLIMFAIEFFLLRDRPGLAGHEDFDTGDADSGREDSDVSTLQVMKTVVTHPVILTIALIEFCTGVLRNGVMHWFPIYAKEILSLPRESCLRNGSWGAWQVVAGFFIGALVFYVVSAKTAGKTRKTWFIIIGSLLALAPFTMGGWGGLLMVAGIIGGNVAGWASDMFFNSRRGPSAAGLYGLLTLSVIIMIFVLRMPTVLGVVVFLISLSVIGTHGVLSGTATMDFGGRKAAATAVGMIDGFVYLGTGVQSFALGYITSWNWSYWPVFLLPFAIGGLLLSIKIWHAKPGE